MYKRLASVLIGASLILSLSPAARALPFIGPAHEPIMVTAGDTLEVEVFISSVIDLFGFQVSVAFDPLVLQATSVTEGPFLASGGPTFFLSGIIDNTGGSIDFIADTLIGPLPGVSGSGDLFTLSFDILASAITEVRWTESILLDSNENPIVHNHVPEPSTWLLLGTGLLGLLGYGWRRQQTG